MMKSRLIAILLFSAILSGCTGAVVGGAATGAAAVHDRRTVGTVIDDHGLAWSVRQAVYADKDLNTDSHINVTVYNNTILLSGEVPTEDLKLRANAVASQAAEGRQVFNELVISAPTSLLSRSNDTYLTAKVKTALLDVKIQGFDLTRVKVTTEAGTVFLMGLLTQAEAEATTDIVRQVSGVKKVIRLFEYISK